MKTTSPILYVSPELERMRQLVAGARAQLGDLETDYTKEKSRVDVVQAALFRLLREHYQKRDRLRLTVEYRRKFLDSLTRGNAKEARQAEQNFEQAKTQSDKDYEELSAAADKKQQLTAEQEAELSRLWKKLVKLYHPDRFANQPDKLEAYHKLTTAINQAKDIVDIETLREIAEDPQGFMLRQGWASLDFGDAEELAQLRRLHETLQKEIATVTESLKQLRESSDYELCQLSEQKPGVLDELAAERTKQLEAEIAELEKQAEQLAGEIKKLTNQTPNKRAGIVPDSNCTDASLTECGTVRDSPQMKPKKSAIEILGEQFAQMPVVPDNRSVWERIRVSMEDSWFEIKRSITGGGKELGEDGGCLVGVPFIGERGYYPKWALGSGCWVFQRTLVLMGQMLGQIALLRAEEVPVSKQLIVWSPPSRLPILSSLPARIHRERQRALGELETVTLVCYGENCLPPKPGVKSPQGIKPVLAIQETGVQPEFWRFVCPSCGASVGPDLSLVSAVPIVEKWLSVGRPALDPPGAGAGIASIRPIADLAEWIANSKPSHLELAYVGQQMWPNIAAMLKATGSGTPQREKGR
jgi:curved DNA-binding protein CbpA